MRPYRPRTNGRAVDPGACVARDSARTAVVQSETRRTRGISVQTAAIEISRATLRTTAATTDGTGGPVLRPFACPPIPEDALALAAQVLTRFRKTLCDSRFALAAVRVS